MQNWRHPGFSVYQGERIDPDDHEARQRRAQAGACVSDPPAVPLPQGNEDGGCADEFARRIRSSWARLIKKVYEADPLLCARCGGPPKIISFIDAPSVIERILRHLKLWDRPERPPPAPAPWTLHYDSEILAWEDNLGSFESTG